MHRFQRLDLAQMWICHFAHATFVAMCRLESGGEKEEEDVSNAEKGASRAEGKAQRSVAAVAGGGHGCTRRQDGDSAPALVRAACAQGDGGPCAAADGKDTPSTVPHQSGAADGSILRFDAGRVRRAVRELWPLQAPTAPCISGLIDGRGGCSASEALWSPLSPPRPP